MARGRRPRNPEKTVRKWIRGGCRKCRTTPAENHGRGLCGACYAREAKAKRLGLWPSLKPADLLAQTPPPRPQALPLNETPSPEAPQSLTVTLTIPPEGRALWERLEREARELWRPLPYQLLHRLSVGWIGSREAVRP